MVDEIITWERFMNHNCGSYGCPICEAVKHTLKLQILLNEKINIMNDVDVSLLIGHEQVDYKLMIDTLKSLLEDSKK